MRFPARTLIPALAALSLTSAAAPAARRIVDCDLCIYGATSGGVIAAAQAVRHGLNVILLDAGAHVGGMSSGGLGSTDKGTVESIGGLSSGFYLRVAKKYLPAATTRIWLFEPKMASAVFADLLTEAAVVPMLNEPLVTVRKTGTTIREIETGTGLVVRGGMYLDTTYEGDLLAAAGVSFRVGREANALYGETKNGVLAPSTSSFTNLSIDPYLTPGNPASGLITGVSPGAPATPGSADSLVQAYNYRLCFTRAANRIPIAPPPDYRAADYEMIGRFLAAKTAAGQAVDLGSFNDGIFHNINAPDGFPGGKSDWNANKGLSSDWIGHSSEWATATYARRAEMAKAHENYIRGIFQFLRTDPRVPANIKNEVDLWGLPPDEYLTNHHWSPQLYVREARRMIGDLVLTEAHGRGTVLAPRPIALGSYAMDSHYCQRLAVAGKVNAEGGFFELPPRPWPIGYGAITPRAAECTNLLATFALSATHVAFSSARMEPVFMMTSHSAATAAAIALARHQSVQEVAYPALATLLKSDGQILEWAGSSTVAGIVVEAEGPGGSPQPAGQWVAGANAGFSGTGYLHDNNSGKGSRFCTFSPVLPLAGPYRVFLSWVPNANRASNATVAITHSGGTAALTVNQRLDPDGLAAPGGFKELGTWTFPAGSGPVVRLDNSGTDGFVIADAVRFEPAGDSALPALVSVAAHDAVTSEAGGNPARLIFRREGILTQALTVPLAVSGTATPGLDCAALPASMTFAAGSASTTLAVNAIPDSLVEDVESLTITLQPGSGYTLTAAAAATVSLEDNRYDRWRFSVFTAEQNADPALSGPTADPDHDDLSNMAESVFGGNPWAATDLPPLTLNRAGTGLLLTIRRSAAASAVPVLIQASADLTAWPTVSHAVLEETTETAGGQLRLETWRLPADAVRRFFRLAL